jgi:hypothetical protein
VLARSVAQDRLTRLAGGTKVICAVCGAATPPGQFCAACGSPLKAATINDRTVPSPRVVVDVTDATTAQTDSSDLPLDDQPTDVTAGSEATEPADALGIESRR